MNNVKKLVVVFAGVISLFMTPLSGQDVELNVSELIVTGNQNISRNGVLSYIKTRVGQPYNEKVVEADCDELRNTGRFSKVQASARKTASGVVVTIALTERPVIAGVEMIGNKKFTTEELIGATSLKTGEAVNPATQQSATRSILARYKEAGYPYAEVTIDRELIRTEKRVVITVVEGPHVVLRSISFEGNHYYNNLELKIRIKTRAKAWPFISGDYNAEKIDRDVDMIRNAYLSEGFLDVEVSRQLEPTADKTGMDLTFVIVEGGRYRVHEVSFEGNTVFSDQELRGRLKLQQWDFFTEESHRADLKIVELAYGELGYIDASVRVQKRFISPDAPPPAGGRHLDGGKPALVNLVFAVVEHDQYRVGDKIEIKGNSITKDNVIRRELRLYPEDLCNSIALKRSEAGLRSLQIFAKKPEGVVITMVNSDRPGYKDPLIEVEEGNTAEFMLGAGVDSNNGLIGSITLTQRNFDILAFPRSFGDWLKPETFKGAGQRFSIDAQPGTDLSRFSVSWFTPYIFDKPYSLGLKAYFFDRGYDSYDIQRIGFQASVGRLFKNRWRGELSTRIENVKLGAGSMPTTPVEIYSDRGSHGLIGISARLIRDRTDSTILPSKGDRLQFGYEQIAGGFSFGKFDASYNIYKTIYTDALNRKHILSGRIAVGQIVGDAPVFEKYYGGGIGSLRGFQYRGISPRGTLPSGLASNDAIGGDTMVFIGGEYSFPVIGKNLRGVLFIDTGTVEDTFGVSNYRVSAGFGLRWTIPMMGEIPMAFNFGIPLLKQSGDETEIFSFHVGASW